jgi:hypothetical protein
MQLGDTKKPYFTIIDFRFSYFSCTATQTKIEPFPINNQVAHKSKSPANIQLQGFSFV